MDLISIVIPIYNVEKYLKKCLDSIINQTYENLEIILVDDGSTDKSGEICDEMSQNDTRIKVIHKKNGGLSDARNSGIDIASGEYIGFVDSDDWIDVSMYEILHDYAKKYDADIVCCEYYDMNEKMIHGSQVDGNIEVLSSVDALKKLFKLEIREYAWNKLYKKSLFNDIRFPFGRTFEDMGTTYKVFAEAKKVVQIPDKLYYYVFRDNSISNKTNIKNIVRNKYDALYQYYERIDYIEKRLPELKEFAIINCLLRAGDAFSFAAIDNIKSVEHSDNLLELSKKIIEQYCDYTKFLSRKKNIKYKLIKNNIVLFNFIEKSKIFMKNYTPKSIKKIIYKRRNFLRNAVVGVYRRKERCAFLIGTPNHDNLGDHAIAYAAKRLMEENLKDYKIIEITEEEFIRNKSVIKKAVKPKDVIFIQGGGNWGNSYNYIKDIHDTILKMFRHNSIFVLPQTIYYTDDYAGKKALKNDIKYFSKCADVRFAARERKSYDILNRYFANIQKIMIPDLVLSMNITNVDIKRKGALICLRNDKECKLTLNEQIFIHKYFRKEMKKVTVTDTCIADRIGIKEREKRLKEKWHQFQSAEIVITDRLHGMIFSAITSTPCIVMGNFNHKVESAYELIKNLSYIKYVEEVGDIPQIAKEMLSNEHGVYNDMFYDKYKEIFKNYNKV